ncbi:hypothetical protein ACTL6U_07990 [Rhodovibrionaceae bacterium A322]
MFRCFLLLGLWFGIFLFHLPLAHSQENQASASTSRFKVTYIGPSGPKALNEQITGPMRAAAKDLNIDLEVFLTGQGRGALVRRAEELAKRPDKPDYVLLSNLNKLAARALVILTRAGIPAMTIISGISPEEQRTLDGFALPYRVPLGSVSGDYREAGFDMARYVETHFENGIKRGNFKRNLRVGVLAMPGDLRTPENIQLREGLKFGIQVSENRLFLLASVPVQWSGIRARKLTREFADKEKVLAVWTGDPTIAKGAVQGLSDVGEQAGNRNLIVTLGWDEISIKGIRDKSIGMAVGGHLLAGAFALVMLSDYHDGLDFANSDILTSPDDQLFDDPANDIRANFRGALRYDLPQINQRNFRSFENIFKTWDWNTVNFKGLTRAATPGRLGYDFSSERLIESRH